MKWPFQNKSIQSDAITAALNQRIIQLENTIASELEINALGDLVAINWGTTSAQNLKDYLEIPELGTAIDYYASLFASAKIERVSKATGEPVNDGRENLGKLLRSPNYYQTFAEYMKQGRIYRFIDGNQFEFFKGGEFGSPSSVKELFTLEPWFTTILDSNQSTPYFMRSNPAMDLAYRYQNKTAPINLKSSEILQISDDNFSNDSTEFMRGKSILDAVKVNRDNIRAAYESRFVLIHRRGALGILTPKSADATGSILPPDQKKVLELQKAYRKYGMLKEQNQLLISSVALDYKEMGSDPRKLMLFEEVEEDTNKICDRIAVGLGKLLTTRKDMTFDNQKQYKKSIFENNIIPDVISFCANLNDQLGVYKNNLSWYIRPSFDHLQIFADDKQANAQTLLTATNAVTALIRDGVITQQDALLELQKYGYGNPKD